MQSTARSGRNYRFAVVGERVEDRGSMALTTYKPIFVNVVVPLSPILSVIFSLCYRTPRKKYRLLEEGSHLLPISIYACRSGICGVWLDRHVIVPIAGQIRCFCWVRKIRARVRV